MNWRYGLFLVALIFLILLGGARLLLTEKLTPSVPVIPVQTAATYTEDDSFSQIFHARIAVCYTKKDNACVCAAASEWARTGRESAALWVLHAQCLFQRQDARSALLWFQKADALSPGDSTINLWVNKAKRLADEENELGILRSAHFDLWVEDKAFQQGPRLLRELEAAYDSLCLLWNFYPRNRLVALLYASSRFRGGDSLPDWTGAVFDGKVRIPADVLNDWPQQQRVIRHEVAHAFHRELAAERPLPTWLEEGLAQDFDGTVLDSAWIREHPLTDSTALQGDFLRIRNADEARTLYQHSLKITQELLQRIGRDSLKSRLPDIGSRE